MTISAVGAEKKIAEFVLLEGGWDIIVPSVQKMGETVVHVANRAWEVIQGGVIEKGLGLWEDQLVERKESEEYALTFTKNGLSVGAPAGALAGLMLFLAAHINREKIPFWAKVAIFVFVSGAGGALVGGMGGSVVDLLKRK